MKIDFSILLKQRDGKDFVKDDPLPLWKAAVNALDASYSDENLTGQQKYERGLLGDKVYQKEVVDLTAEEIVLLKTVIGKAYTAGVVTPAYKALENIAATVPPHN